MRLVAIVLLAGCGRVSFDEGRRGGRDAAPGAIDATPPVGCDPAAPFGAPVPIAELNDPTADDGTLRISSDERSGYLWSRRGGGRTHILFAERPDVSSPFTVTAVTGLFSTGNDLDPVLSTDGALLVFRHSMPGDELYMAPRIDDVTFGAPVAITELNSGSTDSQPVFRPGTDELVFQSRRAGSGDLYTSVRTGMTFSAPVKIAELATADEEGDPAISADGLTLFFRSDRAAPLGGYNIYVATRPTISSLFGAPTLVDNLNSDADDGPASLSLDGCRLYLSSARAGTNDVYVATRGT